MLRRVLCILTALLIGVPTGASAETARVPIVMYHSVTSVNTNDYVLSPKKFESDLKYLLDNGYETVFLSEVVAFVEGKGQLPEKPIVLTFDDGFYNNKSNVLPLLQKYGCKACFMLVGKYTDNEQGEKKRSSVYSYLNRDEVAEMRKSGLCEFGSHTYDMHKCKDGRKGVRRKRDESAEQYRKIFTQDARRNEQTYRNCGIDFTTYAYPYGYYSKETPAILRDLGYKAVLTCNSGINYIKRGDRNYLMALKRWNRPSKYTTQEFFENVCGLKKTNNKK